VLGINTGKIAAPIVYGMLRSKTSTMLEPYTSKIPLGNISDEVGMFLVSHFAKKFVFKRAGIVREALTVGQGVELARIGDAIINGQISLGGLTASATSSNGYVFA